VSLPAGVESAVVVGPDDMLVIRVHPAITALAMDEFLAALAAGSDADRLRGRMMVVAAEQIGVARRHPVGLVAT